MALEALVVDVLVCLLLELGDEKRDQGHPLHNVAVGVSNVKKRCIIVVFQHVQGFVDFGQWGVSNLMKYVYSILLTFLRTATLTTP